MLTMKRGSVNFQECEMYNTGKKAVTYASSPQCSTYFPSPSDHPGLRSPSILLSAVAETPLRKKSPIRSITSPSCYESSANILLSPTGGQVNILPPNRDPTLPLAMNKRYSSSAQSPYENSPRTAIHVIHSPGSIAAALTANVINKTCSGNSSSGEVITFSSALRNCCDQQQQDAAAVDARAAAFAGALAEFPPRKCLFCSRFPKKFSFEKQQEMTTTVDVSKCETKNFDTPSMYTQPNCDDEEARTQQQQVNDEEEDIEECYDKDDDFDYESGAAAMGQRIPIDRLLIEKTIRVCRCEHWSFAHERCLISRTIYNTYRCPKCCTKASFSTTRNRNLSLIWINFKARKQEVIGIFRLFFATLAVFLGYFSYFLHYLLSKGVDVQILTQIASLASLAMVLVYGFAFFMNKLDKLCVIVINSDIKLEDNKDQVAATGYLDRAKSKTHAEAVAADDSCVITPIGDQVEEVGMEQTFIPCSCAVTATASPAPDEENPPPAAFSPLIFNSGQQTRVHSFKLPATTVTAAVANNLKRFVQDQQSPPLPQSKLNYQQQKYQQILTKLPTQSCLKNNHRRGYSQSSSSGASSDSPHDSKNVRNPCVTVTAAEAESPPKLCEKQEVEESPEIKESMKNIATSSDGVVHNSKDFQEFSEKSMRFGGSPHLPRDSAFKRHHTIGSNNGFNTSRFGITSSQVLVNNIISNTLGHSFAPNSHWIPTSSQLNHSQLASTQSDAPQPTTLLPSSTNIFPGLRISDNRIRLLKAELQNASPFFHYSER